MKSIETLLKLSLNPHYQLTEEEAARLREYQESLAQENYKSNTHFIKHDPVVKKHDTEIAS